jgi:hypothetical protein
MKLLILCLPNRELRGYTMRAVVASVAIMIALCAVHVMPARAAPAGKLSPSEIQATFFNGQQFTASTPSNIKFKMTFTADGKMKREPVGNGYKGEGTWKLSKDGFCTTWNGAKVTCFTVVGTGDNKWSVLKGSTIMATWSK